MRLALHAFSAHSLLILGLSAQTTTFDVLITGGRIADGTGAPWYYADVGIRGDTIVAVGALSGRPATLRLDARGHIVAPGFIDIHNHGRDGIFVTPEAQNFLRQGVTTLVEGNDGGSPVPLGPFLEKVSKLELGVNFAMFIGQGAIRREVLGLVNRPATPEEISAMRGLVEQAMKDGAFGLSTGLFYVPGNFTPTEEVIELAKVAGRMGGIHISHMRDEAAGVAKSVQETIRIGEEGDLPTQVTHHKAMGRLNWGFTKETLRLVEEARARGVDVTIDQYPYTASSTGTAALFPQWALEGGTKSTIERLDAPDSRAKIKAEIVRKIRDDRGGGDPKNIVMASCGFDRSLAGKSLADITKMRGREVTLETAAETAMDIQKQGGCSAVYHAIHEEDVERVLRSPYTMIASDGGIPRFGQGAPHPRSYGTFARVLGRYVRERKVITLEDAVRKMSAMPAARLGLSDRGVIKAGAKADLAIFDPLTVSDRAEFTNPHQYSVGFRHVLVNGRPVISGGELTAERSGRVLYGPAKQ